MKDSNKDADGSICVRPRPKIDSTLTQQMTQNYLQAAKTHFQSSNVVEITVETAKEFASTSNSGTVNSSTNLNSIKSTVQSLNITRADPRVTHELFTMKLNSSKPQQSGTFVIEHQREKSAILRRKFVIPYADVLELHIDDRKIILDTYQIPQTFYKKKDESGRQSSTTWSEFSEGSETCTSGSDEKTRLEINFHQPNKLVNTLIHSDTYLQMAANGGLRENYHQQKQDITEPEAFFPVAKNPQTVRAAQLAVLELLKQPERSDVSWLIKMFGGIHHLFKQSLRQSSLHIPVSRVEKEE